MNINKINKSKKYYKKMSEHQNKYVLLHPENR